MKIGLIQNAKTNYQCGFTGNTSNSIKKTSVSFGSQYDKFEKQDSKQKTKSINYEFINREIKNLDEELEKLLKEGEELKSKQFETKLDKLLATGNYNSRLKQLRTEYKKIREMFDICETNETSQNVEYVANFLKKMRNLGKNQGFNRIVGYDNIKNDLKNKFIYDTILKEKVSDTVIMPNAMLFFGPAGNGKTTFATALAEQALMTPCIVNASKTSEKEAMDLIESYAHQSKYDYENSNDKKRSIIIVDEAEPLCSDDSPVLERFKNLIKNCAEEYKCTLFLTTNHPLLISKEFLSKDITPFKVPVAPPDKATCKAIIDKILKQSDCLSEDDMQKVVDEMFKKPSRKYSNGDITTLVTRLLAMNLKPTTENFLRSINDADIVPSITPKDLNKFQKETEELE